MLSCIGVAMYATHYFLIPPNDDHFSRYLLPLRLHIAGGMGALLAGPWQFSDKLRTRAQLSSLAGAFLLAGSGPRIHCGLCYGHGFRTGPAHALGVRHARLFVVFHGPRSLPHGSAWEHLRRSPMDDSQFRFDPCRGHAAQLRALMLFAFGWSFQQSYITVSWLCWVPNLLVAEWLARRPQPSGALGVLIRSPRSSSAVVSNLQPFTRATNFCKVLVFLEGAGISRSSLRFRFSRLRGRRLPNDAAGSTSRHTG